MKTFARFSLVGIVNTVVGYAVIFGLMYGAGIGPRTSNVAGYAVGLALSFTLNRRITFSSKAPVPGEFVRFLAAFGAAFALNLLVLHGCIAWLAIDPGVSQVPAGIAYVAVFYLLSKHVVFGRARRDVRSASPEDKVRLRSRM
jgi:putative flippase GtrA